MSIEKKLIFVLGMHRSGTSVLARMLNLLGVDLGRNLIEAQAGVNEKGFWEHAEVLDINEALLSRLGSCWYDIRSLPDLWWQDSQLDDLKHRAEAFLVSAFASDLALIKDPRLCLLLPFWQQVAETAGWKPVVVLSSRHPAEVTASLCKRDPLDTSTASLLWLRYFHDAEVYSRQFPRCLVDYQQLLDEWQQVAQVISENLDVQWPVDLPQAGLLISKEIDPTLKHQIASDSSESDAVGLLTLSVYRALPSLVDIPSLDILWQEFNGLLQSSELLAQMLLASNKQLMGVSNELQMLGDKHKQALEMVTKRDQQLETANGKLEEIGLEHKMALKLLSKRDNQLKTANGKLEEIGLEHEQALAQLAKYERISQFPPVRMLVNGIKRSTKILSGRTNEH